MTVCLRSYNDAVMSQRSMAPQSLGMKFSP
jgi:hypothetical protein